MPLSDIAQYALQHYALFIWLVTHAQPDFLDGPDPGEVKAMVASGAILTSKLEKGGPSSIYLVLKDAYIADPLQQNLTIRPTERLVLLALMAERPQLIRKILAIFPETGDPLRLAALLQPYTDPYLDSYAPQFLRASPGILGNLPNDGILTAIAALGRIRLMQNLLLRDAVKARYALDAVIVDPHIFTPNSLAEIEGLLVKIENIRLANTSLYIPTTEAISTLRANYEKVLGVVSVGAAITQDAVRRLRLILGIVNASDALFDKLAPK